jgi:hypothetical protein
MPINGGHCGCRASENYYCREHASLVIAGKPADVSRGDRNRWLERWEEDPALLRQADAKANFNIGHILDMVNCAHKNGIGFPLTLWITQTQAACIVDEVVPDNVRLRIRPDKVAESERRMLIR